MGIDGPDRGFYSVRDIYYCPTSGNQILLPVVVFIQRPFTPRNFADFSLSKIENLRVDLPIEYGLNESLAVIPDFISYPSEFI